MDVRRRGDREVDSSSARFPPAAHERCREPRPFARDGGVDRERVERGLDDAEPLRPSSSLVVRAGDEDAKVEFGEGRGADGAFQLAGAFCRDQDRGVEKDAHLLRESIGELAGKPRQIVVERLRCGGLPDSLQAGTADPLAWACRPESGDWTTRDRHGELFAGFGTPQHLADVVA